MSGSHNQGVAIVGMAGRFPGARNVNELWDNLLAGRESISRFTPAQLDRSIAAELREHPRYVAARGVMEDADRFDAAFFNIAPAEALLIDPQQRIVLELCWNALEHAGVDPSRFEGQIGVYAGTSNNGYRKRVEARGDLLRASGEFAAMLANEKDYVATRVAHRMDLHGPALSIHTACSTSLVAVAQAWYALMSWQCDLALAGGINIVVPQESGYLPVEGGMESPDGHCRPFDAQAGGTVFSSGGAVVALKRVQDAMDAGDTIWAVLRGVAVNNDGGDKASFSAPSVRGQAAVIRQALACADVGADSIGYVEAHGTGTALGDPIEVEALKRAYALDTAGRQYCWLGSVKSNLGHLVAASGVTGLIKACLSLHHGRIPATLHYENANPEIDFITSPFKVADRVVDWPRGKTPRRAAVSSFGVGGTNAHVILEEAPEIAPRASHATGESKPALLVLSARDQAALQRRAGELAQALDNYRNEDLPDIAATLALGRKPMRVRGALVVRSIEQARERLAQLGAGRDGAKPRVIFLFPGQGSQHTGMARELVASAPAFREAFERCCALASQHLDRDLKELILPTPDQQQAAQLALAETRYTQPALFAVEYALAEWWESIGIHADAMIGHSSGEYVAACRAGVFTLEQAIALMVARAAAMYAQPRGAMLAVRVGLRDLPSQLPRNIEVAAVNAPLLTVLAGTESAIENCAARLAEVDIASTRLQVSHAFHSALMEGALPAFRHTFDSVQTSTPQRTFYSCVSGMPIEPAQAMSADYWCSQLRRPVRFADALQHALAQSERPSLCLEVGPGQALTGLARHMLNEHSHAVASLGPVARPGDAAEHLQSALGECWNAGAEPDWKAVFAGHASRRVALPGYPFHGESYWIEAVSAATDEPCRQSMPSRRNPIAPAQAAPLKLSQYPASVPKPGQTPRLQRLTGELCALFARMAGTPIEATQCNSRLLELGLDSLALTQAALEIERRFGVRVKFRRLLEDLDNIDKLAAMLDGTLPDEVSASMSEAAFEAAMPIASIAEGPLALKLLHNQQVLLEQQAQLQRTLRSRAAEDAPAPPAEFALTQSQTEKWLAGQYGGCSHLCYNESFLLTLQGPLDRNALEDALQYVIGRHEAFTLSFAADGSVQYSGAALPPPLQFIDISGDDADDRLNRQCRCALQQPFDLEHAPLLRTQLLRLAPERHALLVIVHHLVLDGWSEAVLLDELAQSYNAFAAGESLALAPAASWRAYVLEEAARRRGADAARQLRYWQHRYATIPEPLALPADRPRTQASEMDFAAATMRHDFPPELIARLRSRARQQGITFYSLLLAGLATLLARLSGQHDLTIGIPFAGQALTGKHNLIGDCVNTLPLRMRVEDEQRFDHLASAMHRELLDAGENQDLTLYTVLHALDLPAGAERPRIAEVVFSLNPRLSARVFDKLQHSVRDCERAALFPELFFNLYESAGGLSLDLHYRTAFFDQATVRRWVSHYQVLLEAALENGDIQTAALPLMTAGERRQVLHGWNASARAYDDDISTLPALIAAQAARVPERVAVEFEQQTLSYAQLERRSSAIARALVARGVRRGELVGVCVQRGLELLPALLGIMKSGAAYVPLDPAFPSERLRYMADHSCLRHVVVSSAEETPEVVARGRDLLELKAPPSDGRLLRKPLPTLAGSDLAYVLYTSGSTGRPKGVRILHRNLTNFLRGMAERPGIAANDVLCAITTLSFDIAGLELYLPLIVGARIVLASERLLADSHALMQLISDRGVSMLQTTPSLLRLLLDGVRIEGIRGLKLLVGGEALPRDLAEVALPRCRELWNLYGPTETTIWSTAARVEHGSGPLPIGIPIANTQIYVLDAGGRPAPPGVVGEIWIGGAGVADGYQGRPELTAERFLPNPFADREVAGPHARMYRTGDLGTLREGVLHFHGRADDQIKLRGYRIEPGDIEAVALTAAGVREAAAVAREFSASDKRLVLYVAGSARATQVREHLRTRLPAYMLPQHIEVLDALPKTPNGKTDRKALPLPSRIAAAGAPRAERKPEASLDPLERTLLQIWRDLLRLQEIGPDDNFFDLGGDSLLAVRVFQRAQELTGVNLPLSTLLTAPTIAGQAAAFRAAAREPDGIPARANAGPDPWALLVPLQPRGTLPPLFCIHAVGGNVLGYEPLAKALGEDRPFYGIQAIGLDGLTPPLDSLPAMAAGYRAEIQSRQPHGPYFLAGRSMGGMIAYEIARQLQEQGEQIALLALFDTYGPGNHHFELQRAGSLRRMGHAWRGRLRRLRHTDLHKFREWLGQFTYWRSLWLSDAVRLCWARASGRALPHALRYRVLLECNQRAYYNYVPPPYLGKITLFRAAEHPPEMAASYALGWEKAAIGALEMIEMPGDHDSLIDQPTLVPAFREVLERAQAASGAHAERKAAMADELVA